MEATQFNTTFYSKIYILDIKKEIYQNLKTDQVHTLQSFFKKHPIKSKLQKDCITLYRNYVITHCSLYDAYYVVYTIEQDTVHLPHFVSSIPTHHSLLESHGIIEHIHEPLKNPMYLLYITFYLEPTTLCSEYNQTIKQVLQQACQDSLIELIHPTYNQYFVFLTTNNIQEIKKIIKESLKSFKKRKHFTLVPNYYITHFNNESSLTNILSYCKTIQPINKTIIRHLTTNKNPY